MVQLDLFRVDQPVLQQVHRLKRLVIRTLPANHELFNPLNVRTTEQIPNILKDLAAVKGAAHASHLHLDLGDWRLEPLGKSCNAVCASPTVVNQIVIAEARESNRNFPRSGNSLKPLEDARMEDRIKDHRPGELTELLDVRAEDAGGHPHSVPLHHEDLQCLVVDKGGLIPKAFILFKVKHARHTIAVRDQRDVVEIDADEVALDPTAARAIVLKPGGTTPDIDGALIPCRWECARLLQAGLQTIDRRFVGEAIKIDLDCSFHDDAPCRSIGHSGIMATLPASHLTRGVDTACMAMHDDAMRQRKSITITLDGQVLDRIDQLASHRHESRSAVIERICRNALPAEERAMDVMGSPIAGAALAKIMTSDQLLQTVARLVGEELTDEDAEAIREAAPRLREGGKRARAARRGKGKRGDSLPPNAEAAT